MANTPTYSLKGTRINFNDLRAQSRRQEVDAPKKPSKKASEDSVEAQKLLGGFTPAPAVEDTPAPAPKPTPAPAPKPTPAPAPVVAARPTLTPVQPAKKPQEDDAGVDE